MGGVCLVMGMRWWIVSEREVGEVEEMWIKSGGTGFPEVDGEAVRVNVSL